MCHLAPQVVVSNFDETLPHDQFPQAADYAVETARQKALDVARICAALTPEAPADLIISADTVSDLHSLLARLLAWRHVLLHGTTLCACMSWDVKACSMQCDQSTTMRIHQSTSCYTSPHALPGCPSYHLATLSIMPLLHVHVSQVVEHDGLILEKPDDADHAYRMLKRWREKLVLWNAFLAAFSQMELQCNAAAAGIVCVLCHMLATSSCHCQPTSICGCQGQLLPRVLMARPQWACHVCCRPEVQFEWVMSPRPHWCGSCATATARLQPGAIT